MVKDNLLNALSLMNQPIQATTMNIHTCGLIGANNFNTMMVITSIIHGATIKIFSRKSDRCNQHLLAGNPASCILQNKIKFHNCKRNDNDWSMVKEN